MKTFVKMLALGSALVSASPLMAATFPVTSVINLSGGSNVSTSGSGGVTKSLVASGTTTPGAVSLGVGDTLDLTITFANLQGVKLEALTASGIDFIFPELFSTTSGSITSHGVLELLDMNGNVIATSGSKTTTENNTHIGQSFTATTDGSSVSIPAGGGLPAQTIKSDFASGLTSSVSIYGLHYVDTVDAMTGDPTRTFNTSAVSFRADRITILGVPEPATWAMMVFGFGVAGAALRRDSNRRLLSVKG